MPDTTLDLHVPAPVPDLGSWQPQLLRAALENEREELAELRRATPDTFVHDMLREQLRELWEVRNPAQSIGAAECDRFIRNHLGNCALSDYGTWVWYPWSRRLVHVLPPAEFDEVRLSRNRNKITAAEQVRLGALRIGIAGLSVGQATAVTLAMEGIGGEFVLADFDTLSLSNLNRLRASLHDLGVNKAVLTARQLFELNPYLRVTLFTLGLQEQTLDAFLTAGGRLDLLFEECDDMVMKWRVREEARRLRIPVLMETSDRGTLDIERFDREPERPLFHGRTGAMNTEQVRQMSREDRVAVAMAILGPENVSARLAASAVEIDASLRTWPQLASAVALGAAVNTDAARRLVLGELTGSGRFYVDLEAIVRDRDGAGAPVPVQDTVPVTPNGSSGVAPALIVSGKVASIRRIVEAAVAAPSGGNAQPWRFHWNGARLRCRIDPERAGSLLDFERRATHAAMGAAVENAILAAAALGYESDVAMFPHAGDTDTVCDLVFSAAPASTPVDGLHGEIFMRCTNRRLGPRSALDAGHATKLRAAAASRGAELRLLESDEEMRALGAILGQGDRLRFLSRALHADLMREVRWTVDEAERTRDGIDIRTLELGALDLAALRLTSSWRAMDLVGRVGGGRNLEKFSHRAAEGSAAFGILAVPGRTPADYVRGGRAMQRVWLTATALSLGFQPMAALPYLMMRAAEGGAGLEAPEVAELQALETRARALTGMAPALSDVLWFRVAQVVPPSVRALRRPVEDVLTIEQGTGDGRMA